MFWQLSALVVGLTCICSLPRQTGAQTAGPPGSGITCTWTKTDNRHTFGGSPSTANETECKKACANLPTCTGVDIDPENVNNNTCWLSVNEQLSEALNVTHYAINRATCTATTCTTTWTSYVNTNVGGGTYNATGTTLDACQAACLAMSGCTGVDWDPNNPGGQKCWLSWNGAWNNGTANGVTHYYPTKNCPQGGGTAIPSTIVSATPPSTGTCASTWIQYDKTNVGGGSYNSAGTDLTACKGACDAAPTCTGIDWDPNNAAGQKCWFSGSGTWFNGTADGVTHFQIVRNTNCQNCAPIWTSYPSTNVQGGTYNTAASQTDCQAACVASQTCTGIDWDPNNPNSQKCWLSGNGVWNNGTAPGVTHYYLNRNTNCQTCTTSWTRYPNTNVQQGTYNAAATLELCQTTCLATSGCTGIDWDPLNAAGQKCWFSGNGAWNNGTATGVDHYYPNKNCGQNCAPIWTQYANTNVGGGTYNAAATLDACQSACLLSPDCPGIDWDPLNRLLKYCWLSGNGQWFNGTATGVTHYSVNRNTNCGSGTGLQPSVTPSIGSGAPVTCSPIWTPFTSTNVKGGTYNAATTLDACKAACLALPSCTGIDWDPNNPSSQTCWLSGNGAWNNGSSPGVTHYLLDRNPNCAGSSGAPCPPIWTSYADTLVKGGSPAATAATEDACKTACIASPTCTGIDWDPNNPDGIKCWLSGNGAWNNVTATGVKHSSLDRNTNCVTGAGTCGPAWVQYNNTLVKGGTYNAAASTDNCKTACVSSQTCTGIDWDPGNPDGQPCWLSGTGVWLNGTATGVTHYYLIRTPSTCPGRPTTPAV